MKTKQSTSKKSLFLHRWSCLAALSILAFSAVRADTVAEWKFNGTADVPGSSSVSLDTVAAGASAEATIMPGSSYKAAATGISDKWQAFLGTGYLDVEQGSGDKEKNQNGMVTKNTAPPDAKKTNCRYKNYLGFSGPGTAPQGGTVYLVVNPKDDWSTAVRRGLMGTGHVIDGNIALWLKGGMLTFRVGARTKEGDHAASAALTTTWDPAKWYFVAASWQEGEPPVLYVREMDPAGPKKSPAALDGSATGSIPVGLSQPASDPIAIGAQWINTGSESFTADGADAKIAYARLDTGYSNKDAIVAVFQSLGSGK